MRRTITAGENVTIDAIALTGDATQYTVSGIVAYSSGGLYLDGNLYYGSGDQLILGEEMESVLMHLREYGLRGMEAFYSGFSPKIMLEQVELAERYGFLVTCGSDYHGRNKLVRLGDTGPWPYPGISREHVEELLAEFLAIALPNH